MPPPRFTDVSESAGVTVVGVCGPELSSKRWILEVNGGGAALFDADGDHDVDLWLTNGSTLEALREGKPGAGNSLWRNDGHGRFADATKGAGIEGSRWGNGVAVGDVDNDGDLDVFVAEIGPNQLFLNGGLARFREVGVEAGLGDKRWSSSATFFDAERDGDLDLFVANYLDFDLSQPPAFGGDSIWRGVPVMRGPRGLAKSRPALFRNDGVHEDQTPRFVDITVASGIGAAAPSYALGVVAFDCDMDGDDDLYVANDSEPNALFLNAGNGTFAQVAEYWNAAHDAYGSVGSGMGVCAGDYDGDSRLDLVVTNFSQQTNNLYHNEGGYFEDLSFPSGLAAASMQKLGWGCSLFDADLDGAIDLFVANGHVYPEADGPGTDTSYAQPCQLFLGGPKGRFVEVTTEAGLDVARVHRGAAFGDLDGDGDEDVVVTVLNGRPVVLRNEGPAGRSWIAFDLVGTKSNRSAHGAVVRVIAGARTRIAQRQPGSSFQCSNDPRVRFGLGDAEKANRVEVRWPSGLVETWADLETKAVYRLVEGSAPTVEHLGPAAPSRPTTR